MWLLASENHHASGKMETLVKGKRIKKKRRWKKKMLFMDIWTYEPEKRDEMVKRAAEWKCPEGMTELGYWVDLTGNCVFSLYEVEDPAVLLEANSYWTDIAKCESVPVMEMEEFMKLMPKS